MDDKIYVEAYGSLWEVHNPEYEGDGYITSKKYRLVGEDTFEPTTGTFYYDTVYTLLLDASEEVAESPERLCDCGLFTDEVCVCPPTACCGAGEACYDCPDAVVTDDAVFEAKADLVTVAVATYARLMDSDDDAIALAAADSIMAVLAAVAE